MKNRLIEAFDSDDMKSMRAMKSKPMGMDMGMTMSKDCSGFISMLFKAKEDAHITHIEQRSRALAPHEALSIFYTGLDERLDTFAETVMGIHGQLTLSFSASAISNPLSYMENLYTQVTKERNMYEEGWIQNQLDEILQLIAHTIYRLKYVTTAPGQ
jgi:hypothetical protein